MRIGTSSEANVGKTAKASVAAASARLSEGADRATTVGPHVPDPELMHLINLARQLPPSRQDVVQAAAQRLHRGEYATAEAAQRTAANLLDEP